MGEETNALNETEAPREKYTLKELLHKQELGDLDDLTTEEVNELNAYTRFNTQTRAEIDYHNQLNKVLESVRSQVAALKDEQSARLLELEQKYISEDFAQKLKEINEAMS